MKTYRYYPKNCRNPL